MRSADANQREEMPHEDVLQKVVDPEKLEIKTRTGALGRMWGHLMS